MSLPSVGIVKRDFRVGAPSSLSFTRLPFSSVWFMWQQRNPQLNAVFHLSIAFSVEALVFKIENSSANAFSYSSSTACSPAEITPLLSPNIFTAALIVRAVSVRQCWCDIPVIWVFRKNIAKMSVFKEFFWKSEQFGFLNFVKAMTYILLVLSRFSNNYGNDFYFTYFHIIIVIKTEFLEVYTQI